MSSLYMHINTHAVNAVTFGDWVKGHRVRRELSQGKLSELTGVSRTHINKIENGAIGLPEKDTRARFHQVFGTTEADLEALGIVPRYDLWGRVITGEAPASGGRIVAEASTPYQADVANPFDPADLRWHVVEALRPLDMTDDHNEWLMQMFLRELRRDEVIMVTPPRRGEHAS